MPAPPIHPNANDPVYEIKRRAASSRPMTSEAALDMQRKPAFVSFSSEDPFAYRGGAAGMYFPEGSEMPEGQPEQQIQVWANPAWLSSNAEDTMAHEFAHKRYYEDLSPVTRVIYEKRAPQIWGRSEHAYEPGTYRYLQGQYDSFRGEGVPPNEVYAEAVEITPEGRVPAHDLPYDVRERYYPGFFTPKPEPSPYEGAYQPSGWEGQASLYPVRNPWTRAEGEAGAPYDELKSYAFWEAMPPQYPTPYRPYGMPSEEELMRKYTNGSPFARMIGRINTLGGIQPVEQLAPPMGPEIRPRGIGYETPAEIREQEVMGLPWNRWEQERELYRIPYALAG